MLMRIYEAVMAMRWSQIGIAYLFLIHAVAMMPIGGPVAPVIGLVSSVIAIRVFFVEFMDCYRETE